MAKAATAVPATSEQSSSSSTLLRSLLQEPELAGTDITADENTVIGSSEEDQAPEITQLKSGEVLSDCFAVTDCVPCTKSERRWSQGPHYCQSTGFKQVSVCSARLNSTVDDKGLPCEGAECSTTLLVREARAYTSCVPVNGGADRVRSFETYMFVGAVASLYVVHRRKRQAYQRLSSSIL